MLKKIRLAMLAPVITAITCACSSSAGTREQSDNKNADSIPPEVAALVSAISSGDTARFASMVSYPLARPYPLRDIADSAQMSVYYPIMVDDSLRNIISGAESSRWGRYGWRGWTLDDGQYMWIEGQLYELGYVSKYESALQHMLADEEIASLDKRMRDGGWRPAFCLHGIDDGTVYRVDSGRPAGTDTTVYRLSAYRHADDLHGYPSAVITGRMGTEGTIGARIYTFSDGSGRRVEFRPDPLDGGPAVMTVTQSGTDDTVTIEVVPAYWRDFISLRR